MSRKVAVLSLINIADKNVAFVILANFESIITKAEIEEHKDDAS